jgi:hypothetical protein
VGLVVRLDAHHSGGDGVDLHVLGADIDVVDQAVAEVLEVHLVRVAGGRLLRGRDGLHLADLRPRQQVLAVVQPG